MNLKKQEGKNLKKIKYLLCLPSTTDAINLKMQQLTHRECIK